MHEHTHETGTHEHAHEGCKREHAHGHGQPPMPAPNGGGPTKTEWTCPMHPEIVRDAPGHCPICGMGLEPRTVSVDEPVNPELVDMTRRFWFALALAAPVFLLTMGDMLLAGGLMRFIDMRAINWIGAALAPMFALRPRRCCPVPLDPPS